MLDLKVNSAPQKISIKLNYFNHFEEDQFMDLDKIDFFDINKRTFLVSSLGRLFLENRSSKVITEISRPYMSKIEDAKLVNEDKILLLIRIKGAGQLFEYSIEKKALIQLTFREKGYLKLFLNNKKNKVYSYYGDSEIIEFDLVKRSEKTLVKTKLFVMSLRKLSFSPNDRYLIYNTRVINGVERDLFLYDLELSKSINLTNSRFSEYSPEFKSNSELFFIDNLEQPSFFNYVEKSLYLFDIVARK